ncbi:MAG: Integral rane sensor signal transduction histidine kinase [Verrucomicrobiales bacterium]|nr:Integral rane sensor signal transduction histidine kinase [Verrucomicrobiales bacterium]
MTIRTRLTLWYAGILFVSALLIGTWSFYELREDKSHAAPAEANEEREEAEGFNDALKIFFICGLPAALIGLGGGWFLMRKALAPVSALTAAAAKINERNLRDPMARSGNGDELDRLTEVFNGMTARLDHSFQRIREFTLHASHELKTPLTVMRGEIEIALAEETLLPSQRERLLSQLDELERLTKIVDGLTLLTKADAGQIALKKEPVRLEELLRDAYEDAKILAQTKQISVCLDKCDEALVDGDRHRLRQLLLNLTDNAIKYNEPKGQVILSLVRKDGAAEIEVSNSGAGIPADVLSRVFDRFFRVDESHNNSVDGCGLGLSIAKWIVDAHGGSIAVASEAGKRTMVTVRLPRATN